MASNNLKLKSSLEDSTVPLSSTKWLKIYGLKRLKLEYEQILSTIGFKAKDSYINILKRPVSSRYNNGMFKKVEVRKNGTIYNLTATKENLKKIETQLNHAATLYKNRLDWLTSGSRRTFGVIEEKSICIVIDVQGRDDEVFDACIDILLSLMKEQTDHCDKLNLIRCGERISKWKKHCVEVTTDNLCDAVDWLTDLVEEEYYDCTNVVENILDAASDEKLEAIYWFTNGISCINGIDILKHKVEYLSIPVHVALVYNDSKFLDDLIEISQVTGGRFQYYHGLENGERNEYKVPLDDESLKSSFLRGVRPDVMMVWEELDKTNDTISKIQSMISDIDTSKNHKKDSISDVQSIQPVSESFLTSKQWLKKYGLKQENLTLYSYLKSAVFNHCEGVYDVQKPHYLINKTEKSQSLVHAKYCKKFAHLKWDDGTTKHVHITGSLYRKYQVAIMKAIDHIRSRLIWLQRGSRQLFGTIIERKVILLIDTSSSMASKLDVVKNNLGKLFEEQIQSKEEFNIIQFSTIAKPWREFMVPCSKQSLDIAWDWVKNLEANGSTNTFGALEEAYKLEGCDALYLLTDGRPDQPIDMVLSSARENVPIHTISFNCQDKQANTFLYELSQKTGGRYHYYYDMMPADRDQPEPYESEDLHVLRKEIEQGLHDLEVMLKLRNECISKASLANLEYNEKLIEKTELESYLHRSSSHRPPSEKDTGYFLNRASVLRLNKQVSPLSRPASASIIKPSKLVNTPNRGRPASAFSTITAKSNSERKVKKKSKKKRKTGSEIKKWLKENGIAANKLTILDALSSTVIMQKSTYVPAVKKEVFSKVYGDIFPIFHTSGGKTKEYQIVNPQAVDLLSYEKKLKECISHIESKLDEFISDNVAADTLNDNMGLKNNRDMLMQSLRDDNNLQAVKDIRLLEREISDGRKYLKQSEELRNAVKELSHAKSREIRERQKPTPPTSAHRKPTRPFSSQSRRNHQGRIRYHRVIARSDNDGYYYPAVVDKYVNSRYVNVNFDSGDNQLTSVRYVISIGGSTPCPILSVGDYVFLRSPILSDSVYADDESTSFCYVPGIVQVTPLRMSSSSRCYTVIRFNGTKLTALRKDMIKISRARFVFSVRFIQQAQHTRKNEIRKLMVHQKSVDREASPRVSDQENESDVERESNASSRHSNVAYERRSDDDQQNRDNDKSDSESEKKNLFEEDERVEYNNDMLAALPINLLEEWREKVSELEREKEALHELKNEIRENNEKYSQDQREKMEEKYQDFVRGHTDLMEKHMEQQMQSHIQIKEHYKELSHRQLDLFKEQQQHQENILKELFQQQQEALKNSSVNHRQTVKHVRDVNTLTENNPFVIQISQSSMTSSIDPSMPPNMTSSVDSAVQSSPRVDDNLVKSFDGKSQLPQYPSQQPPDSVTGQDEDVKVFVAPENDALMMTHGDNGVLISNEPLESSSVEVVNIPTLLHIGQEVLARFKDDGWYYRGTITKIIQNNKIFFIEDAVGSIEQAKRDDVITDEDDANNIIGINDTVVALHPRYQYAYAPGIVNEVFEGGSMKVHFYDDEVGSLPRDELYMIPPWKHERDCKYIRYKENSLIGQAVVARHDVSGSYYLAYVRGRVTGPRNYLIEWANQEVTVQNFAFIFGAHTKREAIREKSFVLAISNRDTFEYLPAQVNRVFKNHLSVTFCNNERNDNIENAQVFWVSADYYNSAVNYWKEKHTLL